MRTYFENSGWIRIEGEIGRTGIDGLFMDYATMVFDGMAAQGRHTDWRDRVARLQAQIGVKGGVPVPR